MSKFELLSKKISRKWARFWMQYAGLNFWGRMSTYLASLSAPPYKGSLLLAKFSPRGYVAPSASIYHEGLKLGDHVFIGDRVIIYKGENGGPVTIGTKSKIHRDTIIETGFGGSLTIGSYTNIQPRCQFSAFKGCISIGSEVQIAPNCAFYPYNHGFSSNKSIKKQPLQTRGGIIIDNDVWLGVGVIILDNVHIGKGAVIGAGAVVTRDIPAGSIAAGNPARVLRKRNDLDRHKESN
jgi:acetyltransferase-like isoleucine patch superfamily enzyme